MRKFTRRELAKLCGIASVIPILGRGAANVLPFEPRRVETPGLDDTPVFYWLTYERMLEGSLDFVASPITCVLLTQEYEHSPGWSIWEDVRTLECQDKDYHPVQLTGKRLEENSFHADPTVFGLLPDDPVTITASWLVAVETPCRQPIPPIANLLFACNIAARDPRGYVDSYYGDFRVVWNEKGVFSW
jgi:hypothetical protein